MELVTGPFHPDLERAFVETLRELKRADPLRPIAVVAPSQRLAGRLKELAIEAFPAGVAGIRFFNLYAFARAIFERAKPADGTLLEEDLPGEKLLLDLLERRFADAPYLSGAARAPRTARALLSVLRDLKDASVDPDAALRLFVEEIREGTAPTLAELESPRLAELLSLHHHFDRALRERRLFDRHDVARVAAESDASLPFDRIMYYGFTELVQSQIDLLRRVASRVPTTVFYPYVEVPAFAFAREFYADVLLPMASGVRALTPSKGAPLDLFDPDRKPAGLVARTYTVSGIRDEAWIAAKEVLRWRDRGVRRIGVVARTLDPYVEAVESVFRENAISFVTSAESPLFRDPYVKAARLFLALPERDYSREDVVDLLASPCLRKPEESNPVAWDELTRNRGVGHGVAEWRSRILPLRGQDAQANALCDVLDALFAAGAPPENGRWEDLATWARSALERLLGPLPAELADALASLERLSLVRPAPRKGEFRETLYALLERLRRPVGGEAGVQFLDAMAARGIPFDALVVLGMNERFFPRYILQDPFLRDDVRSRLHHRLGNRIPRKTDGYEEEKLLFELLLASAEEVVLVRRRSDERGRVQVPSIFLQALELPPPLDIPRQPRRRLELDVVRTPKEESVLAHFRPGGETGIRPLARLRGWSLRRLDRAAAFLETVGRFGKPTIYDGHVGDMSGYSRALAEHGVSPTALERLALCPFQYFARQVLDLEPLLEPEAEEAVDVREAGTAYHRALELALGSPMKLELAFDQACAQIEESRSIRYPFLWTVLRESMLEALHRFLDADAAERGAFRPALFEQELDGTIAGMRFRGIADRIDLFGDSQAFRVIDYKRSRSAKFKVKMETGIFEKKRSLQPPVYFLLAAQRFPGADLSKSSAVYAFIEEEPSFQRLDGSFVTRVGEFEDILRGHLDRIRNGRFAIRIGTHCAYCDFQWTCRKNHLPTRRRSAVDDA